MGISESKQYEVSKSDLQLLNNFQVIQERQIHHKLYGDHTNIFKFKNNEKRLALITKFFHDEDSIKLKENEAQALQQLNHQHVVKLYDYKTEHSQQYCSTFYKLSYLFEFCDHNLLEDIKMRRDYGNIFYKEDELWYLAATTIAGLKYLSQFKIFHQDIIPTNILIDFEGISKITFNKVIQTKQNYIYQILKTPGQKCYLSPEQLNEMKCLERKHLHEEISYNILKSDLFSLGVVLMQAALLRLDMDQIYYLQVFEINDFNVKKNIEIIEGQYSKQLSQLIQYLLVNDAEQRVNIDQAIQVIDQFIDNGIQISQKLYSMNDILNDPINILVYHKNLKVYGAQEVTPTQVYQQYINKARSEFEKEQEEKEKLIQQKIKEHQKNKKNDPQTPNSKEKYQNQNSRISQQNISPISHANNVSQDQLMNNHYNEEMISNQNQTPSNNNINDNNKFKQVNEDEFKVRMPTFSPGDQDFKKNSENNKEEQDAFNKFIKIENDHQIIDKDQSKQNSQIQNKNNEKQQKLSQPQSVDISNIHVKKSQSDMSSTIAKHHDLMNTQKLEKLVNQTPSPLVQSNQKKQIEGNKEEYLDISTKSLQQQQQNQQQLQQQQISNNQQTLNHMKTDSSHNIVSNTTSQNQIKGLYYKEIQNQQQDNQKENYPKYNPIQIQQQNPNQQQEIKLNENVFNPDYFYNPQLDEASLEDLVKNKVYNLDQNQNQQYQYQQQQQYQNQNQFNTPQQQNQYNQFNQQQQSQQQNVFTPFNNNQVPQTFQNTVSSYQNNAYPQSTGRFGANTSQNNNFAYQQSFAPQNNFQGQQNQSSYGQQNNIFQNNASNPPNQYGTPYNGGQQQQQQFTNQQNQQRGRSIFK